MTTPDHVPVLVLGARSDIGRAVAHVFARTGHPIQLAARNVRGLEAMRADLALRHGVPVTLHEFDVLAIETHVAFVDALPALPGIAICAVGLMGDQGASERDPVAACLVMRSTYEGPASILGGLAERFAVRGTGVIVGISSVAGERGRATNYVYGSAKAGFTAFLSGLRNRLHGRGVHVVTVLPGFVATKMTEGMELPARLTAAPDEVAEAIRTAVMRRRNIVYTRRVWQPIMAVIRLLPESLFKRLHL
ncbi:SDR family oxidoreductase [Palleronia abyssalis]|uniref:Putative oxidoreductase n=1 Tax=Palleronia abyssalis TaxID=1501240 RepID=A0A2R8BZG0_9RHOB|nr:SDR family oxidoreductase [Palleronia abyssalis]SPJ25509.1 putative oxidoreductase [Palleronia abyssalis]